MTPRREGRRYTTARRARGQLPQAVAAARVIMWLSAQAAGESKNSQSGAHPSLRELRRRKVRKLFRCDAPKLMHRLFEKSTTRELAFQIVGQLLR